jgi:hypothetical protein
MFNDFEVNSKGTRTIELRFFLMNFSSFQATGDKNALS